MMHAVTMTIYVQVHDIHLEDWKYSLKELQSITMSIHTPHCMVPNHIFHLAVEAVNAFVNSAIHSQCWDYT
jgi:hypothetical protein